MIWEDEQEIIEELLYWQKRALQAEKERKYFKQQFLDKEKEIREIFDKSMIEIGRRVVAIKYLKGEL